MHCTQCGAAIPDGAKFCPGCGHAAAGAAPAPPTQPAKRADAAKGCLVLVLVGVLLLLVFGVGRTPEESAELAAASAEERRKGFHCLSGLDGSNRSLVAQVKAALRDPNSFEHAETRITPASPARGGKHVATMQYRARNGFGGMDAGTATGLVDPESCEAELLSAGG